MANPSAFPAPADTGMPRRQKLSDRIVLSLREQYLAGQIPAGHRLPTETRLAGTFEVSRTVIREAIAALVADGLVETRQGAGIFVLAPPAPSAQQQATQQQASALQSLASDVSGNISHALNVLEVRIALEIESAALAATRRNSSQEAEIQERFFEFERLLELEQPTGKADFAFHRSIAEATNNPFYIEVLDALGTRTIPCDVTSPFATGEVLSQTYQAGLQKEHLAIMNAILSGDADQARATMRAHLEASQQRYRARLRERRAQYENSNR